MARPPFRRTTPPPPGASLANLAVGNNTIRLFCLNPACDHHTVIDIDVLLQHCDPTAGCYSPQVQRRLRCEACGSRGAVWQIAHSGKPHGLDGSQKSPADRKVNGAK